MKHQAQEIEKNLFFLNVDSKTWDVGVLRHASCSAIVQKKLLMQNCYTVKGCTVLAVLLLQCNIHCATYSCGGA